MKKPLTSLLILTLILGIAWIFRNLFMAYLFPCEGFDCIGSGILYLAIYGGVAVLGYIILLIWLYKSSGSFTKSFSFTLLSVLILFGIIVTDGYFGKIEARKVMNDAYTDCIKTFSGNAQAMSYCDTYKTLTPSQSGTTHASPLKEIQWGVRTEMDVSKIMINQENFEINNERGIFETGVTSPEFWESLSSSIDLDAFDKLPEYPATFCPSCADSPEEYLTLTYGSGSKTVKYHETFDTIPTIEAIRKILRNISKGKAPGIQNEILGIEVKMEGGLSCPNCIDGLRITSSLIEYDKVITFPNAVPDSDPDVPNPIHFSGALGNDIWKNLIDSLDEKDIEALGKYLPPPDWEGMWLIIDKKGIQNRYIIDGNIALSPKLKGFFEKIEAMKKKIIEQNGAPLNGTKIDTQSGATGNMNPEKILESGTGFSVTEKLYKNTNGVEDSKVELYSIKDTGEKVLLDTTGGGEIFKDVGIEGSFLFYTFLGTGGKSINIIDLRTSKKIGQIRNGIYSPDKKYIYSCERAGYGPGELSVFDLGRMETYNLFDNFYKKNSESTVSLCELKIEGGKYSLEFSISNSASSPSTLEKYSFNFATKELVNKDSGVKTIFNSGVKY